MNEQQQLISETLSRLLAPLAWSVLEGVWPRRVRIEGANSPRVRAGERVPSLAVLRGTITRVDEMPAGYKPARVTLQVGADELERVRVVSPDIKSALQKDAPIAVPHLFVFGLARANLHHAASSGHEPACEILLVGWAPALPCHAGSKRKSPESSVTGPVPPDEQERRRQRAVRFGMTSSMP